MLPVSVETSWWDSVRSMLTCDSDAKGGSDCRIDWEVDPLAPGEIECR